MRHRYRGHRLHLRLWGVLQRDNGDKDRCLHQRDLCVFMRGGWLPRGMLQQILHLQLGIHPWFREIKKFR